MKINNFSDQAHTTGLYLPTRTMFLTGEVGIEMYENVITNLHILDTQPGTVKIYINSGGGDVTQAWAIYDAIRAMKCMVRCVVFGEASSAASLILQAGDDRILTPNSEMMIHVGEEGYEQNHPKNVENWFMRSREVEEKMKDVYLKRIKEKKPRFTKKKFEELWMFDKILKPKESVALGLADKILEGSL